MDKNRDVSAGALVLPTCAQSAEVLKERFKGHTVRKTYVCLCRGVTPAEGRIEAKLRCGDVLFNAILHRILLKTEFLPRQTRDKHRKSCFVELKKRCFCIVGWLTHGVSTR